MRTVLVVTRHDDLARPAASLEREGFGVSTATPEALASGDLSHDADLALVDLRDVPGPAFNIILSTYAERGVAVIAAVAADLVPRISSDLPVDDFVVLPATLPELARRIERVLWRKHGIDSENVVRCGALTIDLANYRVIVDGEPLVLTFKEYELLRFLAMNAGRVFTREQLLNRVWGYDYFGGARTVDVHIRRIRAKIEVHGHAFIETVRNVGYRLVAEARRESVED
jgi:DNA-binding response OmpR family regulator